MAISRETRAAVYAKCGGRCGYCGIVLDTIKAMQVDHIQPKQFRGTDDFENLMPACRSCNNYKTVFSVEEFRRMVSQQVELLRRYATNYRHAERFGLVKATVPERIVFYFEQPLRQPEKDHP